jgi:hypothetical protein
MLPFFWVTSSSPKITQPVKGSRMAKIAQSGHPAQQLIHPDTRYRQNQ